MTQEQFARKAYRSIYGIECDQTMAENLVKFAEEYNMAKALDEFENTPSQFITIPKPVSTAKEIALNAAISLTPRESTIVTYADDAKHRTLVLADEIYQWLTEPETDKR